MCVIPDDKRVCSELIRQFIFWLNAQTQDFVLKGGTSLMICYNLGRFSEDIDLDAINLHRDIIPFIQKFCKLHNLSVRVAKNTGTTKRCLVHYFSDGGKEATLKIETSYRQQPDVNSITVVKGIKVYNIVQLMLLKLTAFTARDRVRDLYDILYIFKMYGGTLPDYIKSMLRAALSYKDMDYIAELLHSQPDPLIDVNALTNLYLDTCMALGVSV